MPWLRPAHDLHPIGDHLRALQQSGVPIAHLGKYHGQFHFLGRLTRPIEVLELDEIQRWAQDNPSGRIVGYSEDAHWQPRAAPEFSQRYRRAQVFVWGPDAIRSAQRMR
jgi:hypothetical protein